MDKVKLKGTRYDHIQHIMQNFDFNIVKNVMDKLNWKWVGVVPSLEKIKEQAEELLTLSSLKENNCCCGGFHVEYDKKDGYLKLSFQIEGWTNENFFE